MNGVLKTTGYSYDANGNQLTVTDWIGNTSRNYYDPLNRLIEKKDPYTTIQRLEYFKNNLQSVSYDALGNKTTYSYDRNGRLLSTLDPEDHLTSQSYDDVGNVQTKTDGRNIVTTYKYDEFNHLISVINPKGEETTYTYDLNGNMLTQTDGNENTTTYEYNVANKLVKKIDHGGRTGEADTKYTYIQGKIESYTYFSDGSLRTKMDRNEIIANYTYDIHGRLLIENVNGDLVSYTYDNAENQLTMADSTGTTTRTYDEAGRVLTKTVSDIGTSYFDYDTIEQNGAYSELSTDPKGNTVRKVFDRASRLINVVDGSNNTTYAYYDNGNRKSIINSDGSREEYTYYKDNLVKTLVNKKYDGTLINSYSYTYDAAHNQTSKIDGKGTTSYIYDSLNRLEKVTEPTGRVTSYTFDRAGNRLTEATTLVTTAAITTYKYNEQNRLMSTITSSGSENITNLYSYDANGNMVSKTVERVALLDQSGDSNFALIKEGISTNKNVAFYEYNVRGQLTRSVEGDKTLGYAYYGDGYRASKSVNGDITKYMYEGDKVVLETDEAGTETARNIYGLNLISRKAGSDNLHYMYNGRADVTALIGINGTVVANYYYDAFGNQIESNGVVDNPYRYTGYVYDDETGLYYLNARYYDSKIARFISEDIYRGDANDPLSLNLYTYCVNNPIKYWDPTGHDCYFSGHYVDENGKEHFSEVVMDSTTSLNSSYIWDKVIIIGSNLNLSIQGNATIGTITTEENSSNNITNDGYVDYLITGSKSTTTIGNLGYIYNIITGDGSIAFINNSGYVGKISTGYASSSWINNYGGAISGINTGSDSATVINNEGQIGHISTGDNSSTGIYNQVSGSIGYIDATIGKSMILSNAGSIDMLKRGLSSNIDMRFFDGSYLGTDNNLYMNAYFKINGAPDGFILKFRMQGVENVLQIGGYKADAINNGVRYDIYGYPIIDDNYYRFVINKTMEEYRELGINATGLSEANAGSLVMGIVVGLELDFTSPVKSNLSASQGTSETPSLPQSVTEYLQGSGGRLGNSATRAQNVEIAQYLRSKGYTITNGAGFAKEEYLPGVNGGTSGSNYVDITATRNGQTIRINTADIDSNGNFTQRELNAANSINQKTGGDIILIPKGSGLGNLPNIVK